MISKLNSLLIAQRRQHNVIVFGKRTRGIRLATSFRLKRPGSR
jgi:hypothetical protein